MGVTGFEYLVMPNVLEWLTANCFPKLGLGSKELGKGIQWEVVEYGS